LIILVDHQLEYDQLQVSLQCQIHSAKMEFIHKDGDIQGSNDSKSESKHRNPLVEMISDVDGYLFKRLQEFLPYTLINRLLNVSIKFRDMKKLYHYWKLDVSHCQKYLLRFPSDILFRKKLNSLITNPNTQLSLCNFNDQEMRHVSTLDGSHALSISNRHGIIDMSSTNDRVRIFSCYYLCSD
jgi:hypothetical protein